MADKQKIYNLHDAPDYSTTISKPHFAKIYLATNQKRKIGTIFLDITTFFHRYKDKRSKVFLVFLQKTLVFLCKIQLIFCAITQIELCMDI